MPARRGRRGRGTPRRPVGVGTAQVVARRADARASGSSRDPTRAPIRSRSRCRDRRLSGSHRHGGRAAGRPRAPARVQPARVARGHDGRRSWPCVGAFAARTRAARDRSPRLSRRRPRRRGYSRPCCVLRNAIRHSGGARLPSATSEPRIACFDRASARPASSPCCSSASSSRSTGSRRSFARRPHVPRLRSASSGAASSTRSSPRPRRMFVTSPGWSTTGFPICTAPRDARSASSARSAKAARVIPNKAFQALATATPLITADTPAARELLEDGRDALLVPPGDPEALARAIRRVASEPALCSSIGARGRTTYAENASEEVLGHRWRVLLERLRP